MKIEKLCGLAFIRSAPLFFELTHMLLQNNCINNGVTNGLKKKKEKKHAKQLYMVKEQKPSKCQQMFLIKLAKKGLKQKK